MYKIEYTPDNHHLVDGIRYHWYIRCCARMFFSPHCIICKDKFPKPLRNKRDFLNKLMRL
jgi:hypothetical protein